MKIERILGIFYYLLNVNKSTISQLSERFEVSRRTVIRDLDTLEAIGIPIVSYPGRNGGIGIIDGFKINKSVLTTEDINMIQVGLDSVSNLGDDQKLNYLRDKLIPQEYYNTVSSSDIVIDLSSWFKEDDKSRLLTDFRNAIRRHQYILIEYYSIKGFSRRKIEPYRLMYKYDNWYLQAYCTERADFRLFKLNRISSYQIIEEVFTPQVELLKTVTMNLPQYNNSESRDTPFKVVFEYELKDMAFLAERLGVSSFVESDGVSRIEFTSNSEEAVIYLAMSLQDKVKLIEPEHIRMEIVRRIDLMKSLYMR